MMFMCVAVRFKIAITLTLEEVKAFCSSAASYCCVTLGQNLKFIFVVADLSKIVNVIYFDDNAT